MHASWRPAARYSSVLKALQSAGGRRGGWAEASAAFTTTTTSGSVLEWLTGRTLERRLQDVTSLQEWHEVLHSHGYTKLGPVQCAFAYGVLGDVSQVAGLHDLEPRAFAESTAALHNRLNEKGTDVETSALGSCLQAAAQMLRPASGDEELVAIGRESATQLKKSVETLAAVRVPQLLKEPATDPRGLHDLLQGMSHLPAHVCTLRAQMVQHLDVAALNQCSLDTAVALVRVLHNHDVPHTADSTAQMAALWQHFDAALDRDASQLSPVGSLRLAHAALANQDVAMPVLRKLQGQLGGLVGGGLDARLTAEAYLLHDAISVVLPGEPGDVSKLAECNSQLEEQFGTWKLEDVSRVLSMCSKSSTSGATASRGRGKLARMLDASIAKRLNEFDTADVLDVLILLDEAGVEKGSSMQAHVQALNTSLMRQRSAAQH